MRQLALGVRLRDRAVFGSFVAGPNAELVAHLESVGRGSRTGVTWIHGASGTGRTHLLQAVCALAGARGRAGFFPLIELRSLGPASLEGAGSLDCACIDDVDLVAGEGDWERAIFSACRELEERAVGLVIAAGAPPAELPWKLGDLRSRLAAAAVFAVRELDEVAQNAALKLHAQARGLELPDDTVQFLQRRYPRQTAKLCRILDALDEASLTAQRRITVPFVREILGERA